MVKLLVICQIEMYRPLIVVAWVGLLSVSAPLFPNVNRPRCILRCIFGNGAFFGSSQLTIVGQREARGGAVAY